MKIPRLLAERRRAVLVGVALASAMTLGPAALYVFADGAEAAVGLESRSGPDALADLEGRSPGSRLVGIATKAVKAFSRPLSAEAPDEAPAQRALGKAFDPPAEDAPLWTPPTETLAFVDDSIIPGAPVLAGTPGSPPPFGSGGGSPGGFVFVPGGGGGGGGGGGTPGGGGGGGTPPPVAAVPEPGTWAMMILGFGVIGAAMRRRERRARLSEAA